MRCCREPRMGATLVEVLVAIFVMGIGLLALLTLFPLGALSMAKAIQDDRAAQASVLGSNIAALGLVRSDVNVRIALQLGNGGPSRLPHDRSYPVLVDPIGYRTMAPLPGFNTVAGTTGSSAIPRVQPSFVTNNADAMRWFTLLDDLVFETEINKLTPVGVPKQLIANVIERNTRFSWAYLVQRPRSGDASVADISVVVFNGRPLGLTGNLTLAETNYDGYNNAVPVSEVAYYLGNNALGFSNIIRVRWEFFNHAAPAVRSGDWVLDASVVRGETHANFYRVAGIKEGSEQIPAGGPVYQFMDLEVQQPLKGFVPLLPGAVTVPPQMPGYSDPYTGPTAAFLNDRARLIVIEGIAEVFERGVGKAP